MFDGENITVIGGGNMGSLLAVKFSQKYKVTLYLNSSYEKTEDYNKDLKVYSEDNNSYTVGKIDRITDDLKIAVENADYIFITFPSFLFDDLSKKLVPLLIKGQHLVCIPGSGGAELAFKDAIDKGCTLSGLQRVHSVARIIEKGKEVRESGVRTSLNVASIPSSFNDTACALLEELYGLPINKLDNYLNITLINSNPILHTSRLYSIFKDYETVKEYDKLPLFYEQWDLKSSDLLIKMDKELFGMFEVLKNYGINVNNITSLLEHYESTNAEEMTAKLNSINSLKGLTTPNVVNGNGKYEPDLRSRYFTADFPFGLDILIAFSKVLNVDCKNMQCVSNWYHKITRTENNYSLQKYGIKDIADLKSYYLK